MCSYHMWSCSPNCDLYSICFMKTVILVIIMIRLKDNMYTYICTNIYIYIYMNTFKDSLSPCKMLWMFAFSQACCRLPFGPSRIHERFQRMGWWAKVAPCRPQRMGDIFLGYIWQYIPSPWSIWILLFRYITPYHFIHTYSPCLMPIIPLIFCYILSS